MEIYQQQLTRKFREVLKEAWEQYRSNHNIEDEPDQFIDFLLDCQLIKQPMLQKYTIQKVFKAEERNHKTKSSLIATLSDRYHLSERVIWNYIKS